MSEYPIPNGSVPFSNLAAGGRDSEKLAGKDHENVEGRDRDALHYAGIVPEARMCTPQRLKISPPQTERVQLWLHLPG